MDISYEAAEKLVELIGDKTYNIDGVIYDVNEIIGYLEYNDRNTFEKGSVWDQMATAIETYQLDSSFKPQNAANATSGMTVGGVGGKETKQATTVKSILGDSAGIDSVPEFQKAERAPVFENVNCEEEAISTELLKEYGNNFFELITYDPSFGKTQKLKLSGVLKELPQFSMGTNWTDGPAATVTDLVKSMICSDNMEMIVAAGGYDRSWNMLDEQSDRTYESSTQPSFDLNFRIYTTENIGSVGLTTWKNWVKGLTLFAQPSISTRVNINAAANNFVNGIFGNLDNFNTLKDSVASAFSSKTKDQKVIDGAVDALTTLGDKIGDLVTKRDDANRVSGEANKKNYYGAKLWKLRIMPGIIQRPIIVYINNWSVTYSKEYNITENNGEPIYVDFKINCCLDQIPNAGRWMYYLNKNTNEEGANLPIKSTKK